MAGGRAAFHRPRLDRRRRGGGDHRDGAPHGRPGAAFPGPENPAALAGFGAPTLVVAAADDPFFPGRWTCERAVRYLGADAEYAVLAGERHFLSPAGGARATERVRAFLARQYVTA